MEWAFGNRQVGIARFLLSQGARLDYISPRGWTPVTFLFHPSNPVVPTEFFDLLSTSGFTDFDVQDRYGSTPLHRAAMWGTTQDVHTLLQLGASPYLTDSDAGRTPAFEAASSNNHANLQRLAKSMSVDFVHHADFTGRTILHAAVDSGGLETMRLVLELGADPHKTIILEPQNGNEIKELNAVEFAQTKGQDTYSCFLEALELTGHNIRVVKDLDEEDVFWDWDSSS